MFGYARGAEITFDFLSTHKTKFLNYFSTFLYMFGYASVTEINFIL